METSQDDAACVRRRSRLAAVGAAMIAIAIAIVGVVLAYAVYGPDAAPPVVETVEVVIEELEPLTGDVLVTHTFPEQRGVTAGRDAFYVWDEDGVSAIDADGRVLWTNQLPAESVVFHFGRNRVVVMSDTQEGERRRVLLDPEGVVVASGVIEPSEAGSDLIIDNLPIVGPPSSLDTPLGVLRWQEAERFPDVGDRELWRIGSNLLVTVDVDGQIEKVVTGGVHGTSSTRAVVRDGIRIRVVDSASGVVIGTARGAMNQAALTGDVAAVGTFQEAVVFGPGGEELLRLDGRHHVVALTERLVAVHGAVRREAGPMFAEYAIYDLDIGAEVWTGTLPPGMMFELDDETFRIIKPLRLVTVDLESGAVTDIVREPVPVPRRFLLGWISESGLVQWSLPRNARLAAVDGRLFELSARPVFRGP